MENVASILYIIPLEKKTKTFSLMKSKTFDFRILFIKQLFSFVWF